MTASCRAFGFWYHAEHSAYTSFSVAPINAVYASLTSQILERCHDPDHSSRPNRHFVVRSIFCCHTAPSTRIYSPIGFVTQSIFFGRLCDAPHASSASCRCAWHKGTYSVATSIISNQIACITIVILLLYVRGERTSDPPVLDWTSGRTLPRAEFNEIIAGTRCPF